MMALIVLARFLIYLSYLGITCRSLHLIIESLEAESEYLQNDIVEREVLVKWKNSQISGSYPGILGFYHRLLYNGK
jgi:hypothetical protein